MNPKSYKLPESVLVVIHTEDLDVLLIERADRAGFWQSVTGSRDSPRESLRETARREVWEETGIRIGDAAMAFGNEVANVVADTAAGSDVYSSAVAAGSSENGHLAASSGALSASMPVPDGHLRDWRVSNVYEIYPVWRARYAPGVTKNTEHVFGLLVPRSTAVVLAPREHVASVWLPYREAADRCFSPSNAEAILQLPRQLSPPR
jgi:dATP pyrophosphohydrolase